jgi:anti-sigma-K factor RskA
MTMPRDADLGDVHTLAGAYALDALSEFERAAFNRHVGACGSCALELAELTETGAHLATLTAAAPPPRLREGVLAAIARTPQERGRRPEPLTAARSEQRWRRWTAAAVAAGIIAVGAAVGTWSVDQQRVRDAHAQARQVTDLLAAPDVRVRTTTVDGGQVTVIVSPSRNAGVAVLDGLPAPGSAKAYELWLIRSGKPEKAAVLAAGQGTATVPIAPIDNAEKFAVSREQKGGSPSGRPTDVRGGVEL